MAKKGKRKAAAGDVATNRQAAFRFNLLERLEAGIVLQGSEVKSLRSGSVQHKREIERLIGKTAEKGLTIVPMRVYFKGPRAKVELAVATGKQLHDKRRAIKDRDVKREIDRALSER